MLEIRRILVPIDESPLSDRALDTALTLAERFGAQLYPLYVRREVIEDRPDLDELEVENNLEAVRGSVMARLRDGHTLTADRIHPELRTGAPDEAIVEAVTDHGIDLVVMGTHGRHGFGDFLRGSTTERVLGKTRASMYVLHEREGDEES
jgi:nucleotide-binding universal stress UspA family protein